MKKKVRPITPVDRMLAWSDSADRASGEKPKARRRTHRRFGQLDVVVIYRSGEPTIVYLTNDEGVIVEAKASELIAAADAVREAMTHPSPSRRKSR